MISEKFRDKVLLITGGTGSFGSAVLKRFINTDIKEIRIFSRDEKKQDDMRHFLQKEYPDFAEKIKFFIGDVRDKNSLKYAMKGVNFVFHAAALKQVPSCEFFPMEAVQTNILGTNNVLDSAIENEVECVICMSTDKAVYPVSAMGLTKALLEKLVASKARSISECKTRICCTRYGNVLCSRGSVVPLWIEQIKSNSPITITDPNMTRFIMSFDDAIDLVMFAFEHGKSGDIFVQKDPAVTMQTLAEAVRQIFDKNAQIKIIGPRHGEKHHEVLLSQEEVYNAEDHGEFFRIPFDSRNQNYDNKQNTNNKQMVEEFNSNNTEIFTVQQTIDKLLSLEEIKKELKSLNK